MPAPKKAPIKKAPVKKQESKADLFIRLAQPRVRKILKSLRILGNCSGNRYEYTQEQIDKISITLSEAMIKCLNKFTKSNEQQESFEF